ncbi:MAG: acetyl-CoA carboxylase biotin carboxylase subunit [Alphaproteobacteria bacterium]
MRKINKIVIANRGEIALRLIRAAREMGIATVAVHSTADADSMHARLADEAVCIGPPPSKDSYLDKRAILTVAELTGADAIHPGVGFLAENQEFAEMVEAHDLIFVGPTPRHIGLMGDKIAAKKAAIDAGLPVVPGSDGAISDVDEARKLAKDIGYPVLIKAASGGGGRGMKVARSDEELDSALSTASREAKAAFGDPVVYIEKYLDNPRHIEIQILADAHGNVIHLGERDCSVQRRHQKVVEEAPSPALTPELRADIGRRTAEAVKFLGYRSVGTVEYLFQDGEFYFIEMNTRLQVEHPVTEMITGLDLVEQQIRVASGEVLDIKQEDVVFEGHSFELRINAEDPFNFMPSPGLVTAYHPPGGMGIRVDSHLFADYRMPPHYDSLAGKIIVHAKDRPAAIQRCLRALAETHIDGIKTNLELHDFILRHDEFQGGDITIHWLEHALEVRASS